MRGIRTALVTLLAGQAVALFELADESYGLVSVSTRLEGRQLTTWTAPYYIGQYWSNGEWITRTCAQGVVVTSDVYGRCCPNTLPSAECTVFPTACASETAYVASGHAYGCTLSPFSLCVMIFVYRDTQDTEAMTMIGCASDHNEITAYLTPPRTPPSTDAAETGISTTATGTAGSSYTLLTLLTGAGEVRTSSVTLTASDSVLPSENPGTTTGPPSPLINGTGLDSGSGKSKSKRWIAGAVVGPCAVVIAGLLGFWIYRIKLGAKKKMPGHKQLPRMTAASPVPGPTSMTPGSPGSPTLPAGLWGAGPLHEAPAETPLSRAPASVSVIAPVEMYAGAQQGPSAQEVWEARRKEGDAAILELPGGAGARKSRRKYEAGAW